LGVAIQSVLYTEGGCLMLGRGVGGMVAKPVVVGEFLGPNNVFPNIACGCGGQWNGGAEFIPRGEKADAFPTNGLKKRAVQYY
jgi:hypothetical protein